MNATPGFTLTDLIGQHGGQKANQLVAEEMGSLLSQPDKKHGNIGNWVANYVVSKNLTPQAQKELLQEIAASLRETAKPQAFKRDPDAFLTDMLRDRTKLSEFPYIKKLFQDRGIIP
jgi:hypothetical protein